MYELKALLEKQHDVFLEFRAANDGRHDKHAAEIKRLEAEIDDLATRGGPIGRIVGPGGGNVEALKAMAAFARHGEADGFDSKAMTVGGDGGVVVPYHLAETIARAQMKYSPLRSVAHIVKVETAASKHTQPVVTGGAGSGWVGESDARTTTDVPTLEGVEFPDAEIYCNLPVSQWWLEDSALGAWLVEEIARAFGEQEGDKFLNGTGTKTPFGILAAPQAATADEVRAFGTLQTVKSGHASQITADGLIDLLYSLKAGYRQNATWLMNSLSLAAVRRLKDPATGAYLWTPSLAPGQPATLLGRPVVECDHMPDVAAAATPIMIGDFQRGYHVVDRVTSILRDPYTSKPNVLFYSRKRVSGNLVDSRAIKLLLIGE